MKSSRFWKWASLSPGKPTSTVVRTITPWNGRAERLEDLLHPARRDAAPHPAQDLVVAVLDRHVEVREYARPLPLGEEPVVDVGRMRGHGAGPRAGRVGGRQE